MPVPVPLILTAVSALLRYRGRVDTILSLNAATDGLPFALPPAPADREAHFAAMVRFCRTATGMAVLEARGLTDSFAAILAAEEADKPLPPPALDRCYALYFEAADIQPRLLAPDADNDARLRGLAASGPGTDMRLAWFVVESHRLSRNPPFTRLALATADTLLEFAGENAGTVIANPRTRAVVEAVLNEFAVRQDFDDESIGTIFQSLLGAALLAVIDNPGVVPNEPALKALFGALGDLRADFAETRGAGGADELIARLVSADGFTALVAGTLRNVAADPSFVTSGGLAKDVIKATLVEFAENFPAIYDGDKIAVFAVVEAGIAVAAGQVETILKAELNGRPLVTAVAAAVAREIELKASDNQTLTWVSRGALFGDIYRVALGAVAANPRALATEAGLAPFAAGLVAGLADTLAATALADTWSRETFRAALSRSLNLAAAHPELVAANSRFAAMVIGAAFDAAAEAVSDGAREQDVIAVVDAALRAAAGNLALVAMDDRFRSVLVAIGTVLGQRGIARLPTRQGRQAALLEAIRAIAVNPRLWAGLDERDMVQPLVAAIVDGLISDPTRLLSGPAMVDAVGRSLTAVARRGETLLDRADAPEAVGTALTMALAAADAAIGRRIDGETLPAFLERALLAFLGEPFAPVDGGRATFDRLVATVLGEMDP